MNVIPYDVVALIATFVVVAVFGILLWKTRYRKIGDCSMCGETDAPLTRLCNMYSDILSVRSGHQGKPSPFWMFRRDNPYLCKDCFNKSMEAIYFGREL